MSWRVLAVALAALLIAGFHYHRVHSSDPGASSLPSAGFSEIGTQTGLSYRHFTGATGDFHMAEIMGPGVALLDYDHDGDLDVFVSQGTLLDPRKSLRDALFPPGPGQHLGYRLFRNELVPTGRLTFTDVTAQAGLGALAYGQGVAVGDYDNDGYPDILATNFGSIVLYHNNRNGTFSDVTRAAGLEMSGWATSASFVDYDRDGYLDLFVARYVKVDPNREKHCLYNGGSADYCGPYEYPPDTSRLFHNLRNGRFEDVTHAAGIDSAAAPSLGVIALDFDHNGWPDIFVTNDRTPNFLWQNLGNGKFHEVALERGCAVADDAQPRAGMGVDTDDIDGSGNENVIVGNLFHEGANLFAANHAGNFFEIGLRLGLFPLTEPYTSFGAHWLDYDNDGFPDLFFANGAVSVINSERSSLYPYGQRNLLLHNDGGKVLREETELNRPFSKLQVGRGVAVGDVDNDGKTDILVANNNGPLLLFSNQVRNGNHWLDVELEGTRSNRMGIGCRVAVFRKGRKPLWRRIHTDGSYMSASQARAHFGLGEDPSIDHLLVEWTDGRREVWTSVTSDRLWRLREGSGTLDR